MPRARAKSDSIGTPITVIEPLMSDPNLRKVKIGAKTVATLRASDVESLGLRVGSPWSKHMADRAAQIGSAIKARTAALRMLGRRARSRAELIDALVRKGHANLIAAQVADEMEADGWLNDREFAQQVAEEMQRSKPASKRLIQARLAKHRIDEAIADEVAKSSSTNSIDAAMALARSKLATMNSLPRTTAARRIAGLLARRGFEEDVIEAVLANLGLLDES